MLLTFTTPTAGSTTAAMFIGIKGLWGRATRGFRAGGPRIVLVRRVRGRPLVRIRKDPASWTWWRSAVLVAVLVSLRRRPAAPLLVILASMALIWRRPTIPGQFAVPIILGPLGTLGRPVSGGGTVLRLLFSPTVTRGRQLPLGRRRRSHPEVIPAWRLFPEATTTDTILATEAAGVTAGGPRVAVLNDIGIGLGFTVGLHYLVVHALALDLPVGRRRVVAHGGRPPGKEVIR